MLCDAPDTYILPKILFNDGSADCDSWRSSYSSPPSVQKRKGLSDEALLSAKRLLQHCNSVAICKYPTKANRGCWLQWDGVGVISRDRFALFVLMLMVPFIGCIQRDQKTERIFDVQLHGRWAFIPCRQCSGINRWEMKLLDLVRMKCSEKNWTMFN